MGIGGRLREVREEMGLTQPEMAALAGLKKQAQLRYEAEERSPDAAYLAAIAAAGADVMYILTGQRAGAGTATPVARAVTAGDRVLLDNFHAAPAQVQAGVKTTLGAFASSGAANKRRAG